MVGGRTKPLSLEEKRRRACEYLMEKKDFFQLKDLERALPKEKGIVQQSVKEVLISLVDDRLISLEKIGISNYFWSFPSTAMQSRKKKIDELKDELEKLNNQFAELEKQIAKASAERPDSEERDAMLSQLAVLEGKNGEHKAELERFRELDPDVFEEKKRQTVLSKEGADRWTDNIFTLQSYCANNFNLARSDFATQFGLPEEFDYVS